MNMEANILPFGLINFDLKCQKQYTFLILLDECCISRLFLKIKQLLKIGNFIII